VPVDLAADRRARIIWIIFLAGPVIWFAHFMLVYLVAEAGCTGGGPGLVLFDPPVPVIVTVVATAAAVAACVAAAWRGYRWWQVSRGGPGDGSAGPLGVARDELTDELSGEHADDDERAGPLAFAGFLLSSFSVVAVLFTAAPALVSIAC
jgi:heme/copper-type cytochrome/quinol oxidase subunit 3